MDIWKHHLSANKWKWTIGILLFIFSLLLFNRVLIVVSGQPGIPFNDPLFPFFKAIDVSVIIFSFTYGSLLLYMIFNRSNPDQYLRFIYLYAAIVLLRSATVFLLPLAEPPGNIHLVDPVLNSVFYPGGYSSRDLFFSGHAASIFLMFFLAKEKRQRPLFLGMAIAVSVLVVAQKVHYTLDVLAAPFFVWMILYFNRRFKLI
ncbi:MAG: hypothetical protein K1X56_09185 [Flavobacteriales bacterium]|nr:hypothetical protein [Flavobacteriales bacterium]